MTQPKGTGEPGSLLHHGNAGNGQTFEDFYRTRYADLVRYAMRHGARARDAEDVAQEVMAQLFRRWEAVTNPWGWAVAAADSEIIKAIRRQQREEAMLQAIAEWARTAAHASDRTGQVADAEAVRVMLASLPESRRKVLAYVIDGYRPEEIADILAMNQGTVRSHLRHARRHAAGLLGAEQAQSRSEQDEEGT